MCPAKQATTRGTGREAAGSGLMVWARLAPVAGVIPLLWVSPWLFGGPPVMMRAGILVAFTIAVWACGVLAEPIAALLFFMLAAAFQIAPPPVVFSGFTTPAWWVVFGGAITTMAVER